jgi:chaperone required for assembly of F1-ATPase
MADEFAKDWFPDSEGDPMKAARQAMRPPLPKRFYEKAGVEPFEGGHRLVLDGRPARTPAGKPLAGASEPLAQALAAEWDAQRDVIDPAAMPVTRILNVGIDAIDAARAAVIDDVARFAQSDLVCYRAGEPARLVAEQAAAWDPILAFAARDLRARFVLSEGVMFVEQPAASLAAVRAAVEREPSPIRLAALHVMTTLTGSVLIALAHAAGEIDADGAWAAAHVDEMYQESVWGEDDEASQRRAIRRRDFDAASTVYRLAV